MVLDPGDKVMNGQNLGLLLLQAHCPPLQGPLSLLSSQHVSSYLL